MNLHVPLGNRLGETLVKQGKTHNKAMICVCVCFHLNLDNKFHVLPFQSMETNKRLVSVVNKILQSN